MQPLPLCAGASIPQNIGAMNMTSAAPQLGMIPDDVEPDLAVHPPELEDTDTQMTHAMMPRKTTLFLSGLPCSFSQAKLQSWLNWLGFSGHYDFLLWFPPKAASCHRSTSYAFINFFKPEHAEQLLRANGLQAPDDEVPHGHAPGIVTIKEANVQGFAANYIRYYKLASQVTSSRCEPYFHPDSLQGLSDMDRMRAQQDAHVAEEEAEEKAARQGWTTVVIRNLPAQICSSEDMASWLQATWYPDLYTLFDFLLYIPPKSASWAAAQKFGYCFLNFKSSDDAWQCHSTLNGRSPPGGGMPLSVVVAHVQGIDECQTHFDSLLESGRCSAVLNNVHERGCSRLPLTVQS